MKNAAVLPMLIAIYGIAAPPAAAESGQFKLQSTAKIQRETVTYDCAAAGRLTATYINADPNFLAMLPVPGQSQPLVFASVIAGSGARYAAGKYVWWTKGKTGSLYDTTAGDNAAPVATCTEIN